jgi:hypothetical protein
MSLLESLILDPRRFVRLRLPVEHHPAATVTITAADPGERPDPGNHDILDRIAAADSE